MSRFNNQVHALDQEQEQHTSVPKENLSILQSLEKCFIRKSGTSTRQAVDSAGTPIFSMSVQKLLANRKMVFVDNNGIQFLRADVDFGHGTRVMSGNTQIGVLDPVMWKSTWHGTSSTGFGMLEFNRKNAHFCFCCCFFYCRGCCPFYMKYEIWSRGEKLGQIERNAEEDVVVELKLELDSRIKAMIMVAAFSLDDLLWHPQIL